MAASPLTPTGALLSEVSRFLVPPCTNCFVLGPCTMFISRFEVKLLRWLGTLKLMSVIARPWASLSLGLRDFLCRCMNPNEPYGLLEVDMKEAAGYCEVCLCCIIRSITRVQELPPLPLPLT